MMWGQTDHIVSSYTKLIEKKDTEIDKWFKLAIERDKQIYWYRMWAVIFATTTTLAAFWIVIRELVGGR